MLILQAALCLLAWCLAWIYHHGGRGDPIVLASLCIPPVVSVATLFQLGGERIGREAYVYRRRWWSAVGLMTSTVSVAVWGPLFPYTAGRPMLFGLVWVVVAPALSVLHAFASCLPLRKVSGRCPRCDYLLEGLRGEHCPECGAGRRGTTRPS